jgi:hypothetical protein
MSSSLIFGLVGVGISTLYIFALHISSLLTLLCIDGEVAGCRRGTLVCLDIRSLLMALWESGYGSWLMVTR